ALAVQQVQLLVRRVHRAAAGPPRPRRGRPNLGDDPQPRLVRPDQPAARSGGALPPGRHGCDHDPWAPGPARPRRHDDREGGRVIVAAAAAAGPCATLWAVTVEGPQPPSAGARSRGSDAPALTADDLRRLTGGRLLRTSRRPIRGAAVDSRVIAAGQLFVALPGERTDGHRFLADAAVAGAPALVISRPVPNEVLDALGDVTVLAVPDGLTALGAIAAGWRARFDPLVVGVTGGMATTPTQAARA